MDWDLATKPPKKPPEVDGPSEWTTLCGRAFDARHGLTHAGGGSWEGKRFGFHLGRRRLQAALRHHATGKIQFNLTFGALNLIAPSARQEDKKASALRRTPWTHSRPYECMRRFRWHRFCKFVNRFARRDKTGRDNWNASIRELTVETVQKWHIL